MRFSRICLVTCLAVVAAWTAKPATAFVLVSPTQDQIVREKVRIVLPVRSLPAGTVSSDNKAASDKGRPFISIYVSTATGNYFVAALSPDAGVVSGDKISFYWDSKAPYKDRDHPEKEQFFKDGKYTLTVNIHDAGAKKIDSASVTIQLRNKVARSNPAPPVTLVNRLAFAETQVYGAHSNVQVYHMVNGVGLPIMGGLGMSSDFKVVQTVDDIRDDGTLLLRCRIEKGARVSSFGRKQTLYEHDEFGPQLYRLVTKLGKVVKRNVFSRQAHYNITDVLPMLPNKPVREGDTWPCSMTLKIEGITNPITFNGTCMLDSFEWQNGHKCAKIVAKKMVGDGTILLAGGKIRSESRKVEADMTTYFAYGGGKMLRNEVLLDFPALILPGAGEGGDDPSVQDQDMLMQPDESEDEVFRSNPAAGSRDSGGRSGREGLPEGTRKGIVQIKLVVQLEK